MNDKIQTFMASVDQPLKDVMMRVINIILASIPKIEGDIKWGCPSFSYRGNMATVNPKIKNYVIVIFHKASLFNNNLGFLEEQTKGKAYAKFYTVWMMCKTTLTGLKRQ